MAKSKKVDPIKQREKRAKIAAIVGGVLFIGVAAFEIPSVMSSLNQKPPAGANATDAGNRNPDGSIALPNVAATSTGVTGNGQLADTDVPPQTDPGQLVSFSVFQTKNPFIPQVTASSDSSTSSSTPPATTPTTTTPATPTPTPTATTPTQTATTPTQTTSIVPTTTVPTQPTTTTPTVAAPPAVAISVNGKVSHVASQGTFPAGAPVFRLVSFTADSAEISIVGGSYATGNATLTLHVGQSVTLENQTDGKKYTLQLVSTH